MTVNLRPLASVGTFVFDSELSSATGETREFSTKTLPSGVDIIDHSVLNPGGRRWTISGRVSNLSQPQNVGRPSPLSLEGSLESLVSNIATGLIGQPTRLADAEQNLSQIIAAGERVTVVSNKRGKFTAFVESWDVSDGVTDRAGSTYTVVLFEYKASAGISFIDPGEDALSLNGSGQTNSLGATQATVADVEFTP